MRRLMQFAAAALTLSAIFISRANHASADSVDTYKQSMRSFAPVINGWLDDVEGYAAAAQAKPELLKDAALAELAARGTGIVGDLAGTEAPGTYADAHSGLIDAITALAVAAQAAPNGDARAFADGIADNLTAAKSELRTIFSYALRGGPGRIELPDQPVSGN